MLEEDTGPDMLFWTGVAVFVAFIVYALRQWIKGGQFTEKVKARGKVTIVTGANSGIGKQLVRELNLRYVKVYMLCRSVEKGRQAARDLYARYGCDVTRMIVLECDLTDFASIRRCAKEFNAKEEKLDILINNAGVMLYPKFEKTVDGHETTWQSNYLGHFLLTELLLEKLERSEEGGRIVNVSSKVHLHADTVDMEICDSKKHFGQWMITYARSKLANVMHAVALTKRIRAKDPSSKITVNSCHPGVVDTGLVRVPFLNTLQKIFAPFVWFVFKTAQDGAQTPLHLALSKKLHGVSGKYYSDCTEVDPHPLARDEAACELLYNQSVEVCGLDKTRY